MSLSRKERRDAAKKMGYLKSDSSFSNFAQRLSRSKEAGNMIHKKNLEDQRWETKKALEEKERNRIMKEIESTNNTSPESFSFDPTSFGFLESVEPSEDQPQ